MLQVSPALLTNHFPSEEMLGLIGAISIPNFSFLLPLSNQVLYFFKILPGNDRLVRILQIILVYFTVIVMMIVFFISESLHVERVSDIPLIVKHASYIENYD